MKKFTGILFLSLVGSIGAFATTYTDSGVQCSTGQANNGAPDGNTTVGSAQITGSGSVPSIVCSSLALPTNADYVSSISVLLVGSFDGGTAGSNESVAFTFTMPTTISGLGTVSFAPSSPTTTAGPATISANNTVTSSESAQQGTAPITIGGFTIGVTDTITGNVVDATATAYVTYTYDVPSSGTPEPVSMLLFGSGLLAVSLIARKKIASK